jgi:hypothetical protein
LLPTEDSREEARRLVNNVLEKMGVTDEFLLSLTYSVNGIVLYFDNKFEDALVSFRKSVEKDNQNGSSVFNRLVVRADLPMNSTEKGLLKKPIYWPLRTKRSDKLPRF